MTTATMRAAGTSSKALPRRFTFSLEKLRRLPVPPPKKQTWVYDSRTPGLQMLVTPGNARTFFLYRKVQGRPQRLRLGALDEIGVEQARKLASKFNGQIAEGKDPVQERKQLRASLTFKELFDLYLERWAKIRNRDWKHDEQKYRNYLSGWGSRRANTITHSEVAELHTKIGKDKPGSANRLLALVSSIFNRAASFGLNCANPAKGVRRFDEKKRDRFLSGDELRRFFEALEAEPNQLWRDFFEVLLLTGQRVGNVRSMEWGELNFPDAIWTIPSTKFKTGQKTGDMRAPMTPRVVEILKARHASAKRDDAGQLASQYVFPSYGKRGYIAEPKIAWQEITKRAKLGGVWIHDLRRTNGSWQAAGGASLIVIGKSLGHTQQSTTTVYARLDLDPVRASIDAAGAAMMKAAKSSTKKKAVK